MAVFCGHSKGALALGRDYTEAVHDWLWAEWLCTENGKISNNRSPSCNSIYWGRIYYSVHILRIRPILPAYKIVLQSLAEQAVRYQLRKSTWMPQAQEKWPMYLWQKYSATAITAHKIRLPMHRIPQCHPITYLCLWDLGQLNAGWTASL